MISCKIIKKIRVRKIVVIFTIIMNVHSKYVGTGLPTTGFPAARAAANSLNEMTPSLFVSTAAKAFAFSANVLPQSVLGGQGGAGFGTTLYTGICFVTIFVCGTQRVRICVSYTVFTTLSISTFDF